jgi:CRISPR-associated exonuclease Cas4
MNDFAPISALQHIIFCPRQCALIHNEQQWAENNYTIQGELLHERVVDTGFSETRHDCYMATALRLVSEKYKLTGIADKVEFWKDPLGVKLPNKQGLWRPVPVEYKRGKSKISHCDRVQLCAQALCLEEMLHVDVPRAALFYNQTHSREWVELDLAIRNVTIKTINDLHLLLNSRKTPDSVYEAKCKQCSLIELCQPQSLNKLKAEKMYKNLFKPLDL